MPKSRMHETRVEQSATIKKMAKRFLKANEKPEEMQCLK